MIGAKRGRREADSKGSETRERRKGRKKANSKPKPKQQSPRARKVVDIPLPEITYDKGGPTEEEEKAIQAMLNAIETEESKQGRGGVVVEGEEFRELYMSEITEGFGDDLDAIRKAVKGGFGNREMELLVDCLTHGLDLYDEESKAVYVATQGDKIPLGDL
ncbi:hypothetical protein AAMO2058_000577500 [Amorphochlora amoebiformis]